MLDTSDPILAHAPDMATGNEQISELLNIQYRLQAERDLAHMSLRAIGDAVITTDAGGHLQMLNPEAERLVGWSMDDAKGRPIEQVMRLVDEDTRSEIPNPVRSCLSHKRRTAFTEATLLISREGRQIHISDSVAPICDEAGRLHGAVMVFRDVSMQQQLLKQISYQATHDLLTGLVNRHEFERRLALVIEHSRQHDSVHALLYIDLDQFKTINDTCGHGAGDEMLRQITGVLRSRLRERDTLARLGGDEFGLILGECGLDEAGRIAHSLRMLVEELRFNWQDKPLSITISIGVVPVDSRTPDCATVLSRADAACYVSKQLGRNRVHVFEHGDEDLERHRSDMRWASRLRTSITQRRFRLYCQPIVALATWPHSTADLGMGEILLRLADEEGRISMPDAFLPAAERLREMMAIDRWVITEAFAIMANPGGAAVPTLCSINLSGQSLSHESFLDFVVTQIEESKVEPERICLEITETAAISNLGLAVKFISTLRATGVRFALDDFGTGLASFAYLKALDVDYIKISGHFIREVLTDPLDFLIVDSIQRFARLRGLKTIAEWVEDNAVINRLKEIGVDYVQGAAIAMPGPLSRGPDS